MKRSLRLLPFIVIVMLSLFACTPNKDEDNNYIVIQSIEIPTPNAITGVVYGKIISNKTGSVPEANLFLAKNITADQPNLPAMLSFSYQTSPRANVDEYGNFCFANVPEGIYAITLWTPPNDTFFVPDEDEQDYLWVNVKAGSSIDMGELMVP